MMVGSGWAAGETEYFPFNTEAHQGGIFVPRVSGEELSSHVGNISVSKSANVLLSQLVNGPGISPPG